MKYEMILAFVALALFGAAASTSPSAAAAPAKNVKPCQEVYIKGYGYTRCDVVSLIGSSTSSGRYSVVSVTAEAYYPQEVFANVTTSRGGVPVHLNWVLTCSQFGRIFGKSGSSDSYTPTLSEPGVNLVDSRGYFPGKCTVSVLAQSSSDTYTGVLRIRLYMVTLPKYVGKRP